METELEEIVDIAALEIAEEEVAEAILEEINEAEDIIALEVAANELMTKNNDAESLEEGSGGQIEEILGETHAQVV